MLKSINEIELSYIAKSSPLYNYWHTNQDEHDEKERLLIANKESSAVFLFNKEPYKWENLYQSTVIAIYRGDKGSIKAFRVLMETIDNDSSDRVKDFLRRKNIFDEDTFKLINDSNRHKLINRRNSLRFLAILFAIFTNPYNLEIKGQKKYLYEKTGWIIYSLKSTFSKILNL